MSPFDIVLLCIIGGFALFGLWFGLIHTLGSLIGTVFGVFLASRYYEPLANWLIGLTGWNANFSKVFVFILAFIIINRLVGFGFFILDKILSIVTHLPFVNSLNRLLGMVFGAFEALVVVGIAFDFIARFPLSLPFMSGLATSKIAPYAISIGSVLWPLVPEAIKILQSTVQGIM